MQHTTTFALLKKAGACDEGYRKLAKHLGGITKYGRNKPIPLAVILESNGIEDAIWSLRATEQNCDREARLFACECALSVIHLYDQEKPDDKRPRNAIEVAQRYAIGEASVSELAAARDAASAAAWAAASAAARDAASAAASAAARDAASAAAWDAQKDLFIKHFCQEVEVEA